MIRIAVFVSKLFHQQSSFFLNKNCFFKFVTFPPHRSHILQADSAEILHQWISALHKGIGAAINCGQLSKLDQSTPGSLGSSLPGASNFKKM